MDNAIRVSDLGASTSQDARFLVQIRSGSVSRIRRSEVFDAEGRRVSVFEQYGAREGEGSVVPGV